MVKKEKENQNSHNDGNDVTTPEETTTSGNEETTAEPVKANETVDDETASSSAEENDSTKISVTDDSVVEAEARKAELEEEEDSSENTEKDSDKDQESVENSESSEDNDSSEHHIDDSQEHIEPYTTVLRDSERKRNKVSGVYAQDSADISLEEIAAIRTEALFGSSHEPADATESREPAQLAYEGQEANVYDFAASDEDIIDEKSGLGEGSSSSRIDSPPKTTVTAINREAPQPKKTRDLDVVDEDYERDAVKAAKRGTLDFGLLLLRFLVAALILFKSAEWLFGISSSIKNTEFAHYLTASNIRFKPEYVNIMVWAFTVLFIVSGLALILGLYAPFFAGISLSIQLVLIVTHIVAHGHIGIDVDPALSTDSLQPLVILALLLTILIFTGPGKISLDFNKGWSRRPYWGSIFIFILAIAAAAGIWVACNGYDPLSALNYRW